MSISLKEGVIAQYSFLSNTKSVYSIPIEIEGYSFMGYGGSYQARIRIQQVRDTAKHCGLVFMSQLYSKKYGMYVPIWYTRQCCNIKIDKFGNKFKVANLSAKNYYLF